MNTVSTDSRTRIRNGYLANEHETIRALIHDAGLSQHDRTAIADSAATLVRTIRRDSAPTIMESFLGEYGLSTREGVALMCLAEALLRVPDARTIDDLIADKIAPSKWGRHLGHSSSSLVNASTWGLLLTGKVVSHDEEGLEGILHGIIRRLGEPVVRTAVARAMKELGRQFVLGRTIDEAMHRAGRLEDMGYTYSYDMLGEAAMTEPDARRYHLAYSNAITALAGACIHDDIRRNPGISVKFSALHPRYETTKRTRVMDELVARAASLAMLAKSANMGFNVDAEEANRLDLSLDVIEAVLSNPALAGWSGFGVVVQAYGRRAAHVLDWLYELAARLDRRIMVRLVKGAYWDTEIKLAQTLGLDDYPVFTRKMNTDISYIACAQKLLGMADRIYAQFATHNAHTVSAVLHLARKQAKQGHEGDEGQESGTYEFQRLHGMGESLHEAVFRQHRTRCRIYAPVGTHRDLLAYLVRRLLENGANSSFVNQIVDDSVPATDVARDPFAACEANGTRAANPNIAPPPDLFGTNRRNSRGRDVLDPAQLADMEAGRTAFRDRVWRCAPMIAGPVTGTPEQECRNPADPSDTVGIRVEAAPGDVKTALDAAQGGFREWSAMAPAEHAAILRRVGELYEAHAHELFALAAREAGKTIADCVGEVREAVDFARYYAHEAVRLADRSGGTGKARGVFACISPWNFPLAIFSGQITAALAAGNAVIAKPADQTPLIAARAVELMHEAGVPVAAIQLLPGSGRTVGEPLLCDARIAGVCFTGSTATARRINTIMADHQAPDAPLLAETGGLNAMIVDSTALPEQAVRDVAVSAFQSAGQRCSALRVLYLQHDIEERFLDMFHGAMDELEVGNPWHPSVDVGPVIDVTAKRKIDDHIAGFRAQGRVLKQAAAPAHGLYVPPTVIKPDSIADLHEEVFGPVLHVVSFEARDIDRVIEAINATGYGLTFGLHTRVDSRIQRIIDRIRVGNIYVNRNQIGAVVGSQPFGGEGLSGTGPKAGGPHYVPRFTTFRSTTARATAPGTADSTVKRSIRDRSESTDSGNARRAANSVTVDPAAVQDAIDGLNPRDWSMAEDRAERLKRIPDVRSFVPVSGARAPVSLPGPTGESNQLSLHPRGIILCVDVGGGVDVGVDVVAGVDQGQSQDTGPDPDPAVARLRAIQAHVIQALAAGNGAVVVAPEIPPGLVDLTEDAGIPLALLAGRLHHEALRTLTGFDAVAGAACVACAGDSTALRAVRQALAARPGGLVPVITEHHAPERYALERHVCIDTTAAGGNASLLSAADE